MAAVPFHLRYDLPRSRRVAALADGWQPCLAACLGFTLGMLFLGAVVSPWFFALLVFPVIVSRRFFAGLLRILLHPHHPVEVDVADGELTLTSDAERLQLPLEGIVQVFRDGGVWTVLHLDGTALAIPADAIAAEQVDYLKSFARRAAAERGREP